MAALAATTSFKELLEDRFHVMLRYLKDDVLPREVRRIAGEMAPPASDAGDAPPSDPAAEPGSPAEAAPPEPSEPPPAAEKRVPKPRPRQKPE